MGIFENYYRQISSSINDFSIKITKTTSIDENILGKKIGFTDLFWCIFGDFDRCSEDDEISDGRYDVLMCVTNLAGRITYNCENKVIRNEIDENKNDEIANRD